MEVSIKSRVCVIGVSVGQGECDRGVSQIKGVVLGMSVKSRRVRRGKGREGKSSQQASLKLIDRVAVIASYSGTLKYYVLVISLV